MYNPSNSKMKNDYEKGVETSIREENDGLIGRISSNIREFKNLNYDLNDKINSTNKYADSMHSKYDKSTTGLKKNMGSFVQVISNKQGSICWFIVFLFVLIFFIKKYLNTIEKIDSEYNTIQSNLNISNSSVSSEVVGGRVDS